MTNLSHLCIVCKKCDEKLQIPNDKLTDYINFSKSKGWLLSAPSINEAYCPECTRSMAISYIMDQNHYPITKDEGGF